MALINMGFNRTSPVSGVNRTKVFTVDAEKYAAWELNKMFIQDAFPDLSDADREFIISGCTDEEFNELFPPE